jgi:hypothetical protein
MWMLADNDVTTTLVALRATREETYTPLDASRFIGVRSEDPSADPNHVS